MYRVKKGRLTSTSDVKKEIDMSTFEIVEIEANQIKGRLVVLEPDEYSQFSPYTEMDDSILVKYVRKVQNNSSRRPDQDGANAKIIRGKKRGLGELSLVSRSATNNNDPLSADDFITKKSLKKQKQ